MKKLLFLFTAFCGLSANAQVINNNVEYRKVAMFTGKPIVQDTCLIIKSGNDTLTVSNYSDATKLNTTAGNGFCFRKSNASGYQFLFGDSANGSGNKFLSYVDNSFRLNAFRFGTLANLSGFGFGNGDGYWNSDSIGIGSVVFGVNSRAKGFGSAVFGGANCYAQSDYSIVMGGRSNHADGEGAMIISSGSDNRASNKYSTIIQSTKSYTNYDANYGTNLIINSNYCSTTDSVALAR